jgi:DNA-binding NarL/FixJ family response regulator
VKTLTPPTLAILSKRQEEFLRAACDGAADKVIAAELGV